MPLVSMEVSRTIKAHEILSAAQLFSQLGVLLDNLTSL